jgi:hypothetical protein
MTYFYSLHFVMGVCKQQQMLNQFAKAFKDTLSSLLSETLNNVIVCYSALFKIYDSRKGLERVEEMLAVGLEAVGDDDSDDVLDHIAVGLAGLVMDGSFTATAAAPIFEVCHNIRNELPMATIEHYDREASQASSASFSCKSFLYLG